MYRDPTTGRKMSLTSPPLALGQAVHETVESLSELPVSERFKEPLMERFGRAWQKISGERGGFFDQKTEQEYKKRGQVMIRRMMENPGPLEKLAVKIKMDLPHYWLSEEDGIILCGKIDWLGYLEKDDRVHIIDFKTGKRDEEPDSLQLPIYHLLVSNCQNREVARASYWYLRRNDEPTEVPLPDLEEAYERVLKVAKQMKLARQLDRFKCPEGESGCWGCRSLEAIYHGEGKLVGVNDFKQDVYVLKESISPTATESVIL